MSELKEMVKTCMIRFKPLQPWFFGCEKTFGFRYGSQEDSEKAKENIQYYVHSMDTPQQTTLLGAVKYLLLKDAGMLKADWNYNEDEKNAIEVVAGRGRFDALSKNETDIKDYMGLVKRMSSLMLNDGMNFWIPAPCDHKGNSGEEYEPYPLKSMPKNIGSVNKAVCFEGFDAKKVLFNGWMKVSDGVCVKTDELIKEDEQVGIEIGSRKEDKHFYKQGYKVFDKTAKDFTFCVFVEINDEPGINLKKINTVYDGKSVDYIISMGGRGSLFKAELTINKNGIDSIRDEYLKIIKKAHKAGKLSKIVLLSDALVQPGELTENAALIACGTKPFRGMVYNKRDGSPATDYENSLGRQSYNLLTAGGVIYTSPDKIDGILESYNAMTALGYNFFATI